jgi:hypothetical protein
VQVAWGKEPIQNSRFKIQEDHQLEISNRSRKLEPDNGDAKPSSARHESPITNRQLTIPAWGLVEHLGQGRISGNSGDQDCTAGGRAAGKSGVGGHDVYDNAGTSMHFRNFVIIRMLLIGKQVTENPQASRRKKGELKNEGWSHDVIENKRR